MDVLEALGRGVQQAERILDEGALEPDPGRADWAYLKPRLRLLFGVIDDEIDARLSEVFASLGDDDEMLGWVRERVGSVLGAAGALAHVSGDVARARRLFARAAEAAGPAGVGAELTEAASAPDAYAALVRARWLRRQQRHREADKALRSLGRSAPPALRQAARRERGGPRPVDGLTSPSRVLAAVLVAAAVVGGLVGALRESPSQRAQAALEQARQGEAAGNREASIAAYREVAHTYTGEIDVTPAGDAVVRLASEGVRSPCTADQLEAVGRVVASFYDLPDGARQGPAAARLSARLLAWAGEVGEGDAARAEASLAVLDLAGRVAEGDPAKAEAAARSAALRRSLADRLAGERPLRALAHYVRLPRDGEALAAARAILDSFGEAPSLWVESEAQVLAWLEAAARMPSLAGSRGEIEARLGRAREVRAADVALAESAGEAELAAALARSPGHQELAAALASAHRTRGDAKGAVAVLSALGPPGRLTAEATRLLAACHADAGELARADELLTALVDDRLAAFQQAQREYEAEVGRVRLRLLNELREDHAPPDLRARLEGASHEEQGEAIRAWLSEQVDRDKDLGRLRDEYLREGGVVPASIELGTLRLRRAGGAAGEAKRALLAGAERAFLAIRQEAEGSPTYRLTLGQIYYRLGRVDDAKREFQGVVDRGDPALTLQVAWAQRDLKLVVPAKKLAEGVYASAAPEAVRYEAANLLAHTAGDLDEASKWVERGDPKDGATRRYAREIEARKLLRAGKGAEADRVFAEMCREFERDAKHSAAAANNAALNYGERFQATGDPAHLRASVRWLGEGERLEPQNALLTDNHTSALERLGAISVLEAWVRTRALQPDDEETTNLVGTLADGPLGAELAEAVRREPSLRAALERARRMQALAPQAPEGYWHEYRRFFWTRDARAMGELAARLSPSPVDYEYEAGARRAFERGESDGELSAAAAAAVERTRARLGRVRALGHAPTTAVASFLHGEALARRALFDPAPIDEMVGAYRAAVEGWPAAGFGADLREALLFAAAARAAEGSPALREAWSTEQRRFGSTVALWRAARGPAGGEVLAALRARPELGEALRAYKASSEPSPSLEDWIIAELAGDAEAARAASAVFDRAELVQRMRIKVALAPGETRERDYLALFERRGAL